MIATAETLPITYISVAMFLDNYLHTRKLYCIILERFLHRYTKLD